MLPARATVPDSVTVVAGDLIIIADEYITLNKNLTPNALSGLTSYAYPYSAGCTTADSTWSSATCPFLGVAMDDSPSGSTDAISVATGGVFEFPLVAKAGVTLGQPVNAVRPTGFSRTSRTSGAYQVYMNSGGGVTIGYCVSTLASANSIRVQLRTKFGIGGIIGNR